MRFVAVLLMLVACTAYGQVNVSNVSGEYVTGGAVTISGSGFGAKSPAAPLFWADFEEGSDGAVIGNPAIGSWFSTLGYEVYDDSLSYGGTMSAKIDRYAGHSGDTFMMNLNGPKQIAYINGQVAINPVSALLAENGKFMRLNPAKNEASGTCGVPGYIYGAPNIQVGCERGSTTLWVRANAAENPITCLKSMNSTVFPGSDGQFVTFEMAGIIGTEGVADGYAMVRIGSHYDERSSFQTNCDPGTDPSWCDGYYTGWMLSYLSIEQNPLVSNWWDNLYADDTLARVVIGDATTLAGCSVIDPQIPSAWSATSISVEFNQGAHSAQETVYLFVVDENGTANSTGYPLTIGGVVVDPGPPGTPIGATATEN